MMNCCQCQGIEELFSQQVVAKDLTRYQTKGPDKTTRMLTDAIKQEDIDGLTLLDIGGGVGAIQYDLIDAGAQAVTSVDASAAYINAAKTEARRRGQSNKIAYHYGDFVDLATDIAPADIVTLDRVICCYDDMRKLVNLSAARARKLYGLVYPRDTWWVKLGVAIMNYIFRLRRSSYRSFSHPTKEVEAVLKSNGLHRHSYHRTMIWQVVVYTR